MRVRQHLRSNVVGYLALFVALTGTAVAADGPLPGQDQVGSRDIINGEVATADISNTDGVRTQDVRDDTLAGGGLTAADLRLGSVESSEIADNAVGSAEIAFNGVGPTEIAANAIDRDEVVDYGLTNEDVGVLFAQVDYDGTLTHSSGGVSSLRDGEGIYNVTFPRSIKFCAYGVTRATTDIGGHWWPRFFDVFRADSYTVRVYSAVDQATRRDSKFHLIVVC